MMERARLLDLMLARAGLLLLLLLLHLLLQQRLVLEGARLLQPLLQLLLLLQPLRNLGRVCGRHGGGGRALGHRHAGLRMARWGGQGLVESRQVGGAGAGAGVGVGVEVAACRWTGGSHVTLGYTGGLGGSHVTLQP